MAQSDLRFTFEVASPDEEETSQNHASLIQLDVLSFTLEEGLNKPFILDLELISFDSALDFNSIIDKPAVFTIYQQGAPVRFVHGLVSTFEQGQTGHHRTFYKARIEPSLSRANLVSDWRVWQQKTSEEILADLFKANHILH
ncbi:MAG: contractile injection system protein, VgrG/Pvc8 family, partial [Saezia sp.]